MDYKKEYEEMVQRVKELHKAGNALTKKQMEIICPELAESEDERIRRKMIEHFKSKTKETWCNMPVKDIIAYLEKQKYNRMQPIYDNQESFESALDKAWKSYNESGARTVDGCEDDYVECAHAKGFREGYLFGLEKQKEHQNKSDALGKTLGRDLTFPQDKDKNLDEIAQDYVNGVKEYNPEPTWDLMQTAVCYGYHLAEQKPAEINEYEIIKKHITEDSLSSEVNKRLKECGWYVTDEKPAEKLSKEEYVKKFKALCNAYEIKLPNRDYDIYGLCEDLHKLFRGIQKPAEWSEEDKDKLEQCIRIVSCWEGDYDIVKSPYSNFLKSLRPQYHGDVTMAEAYKMGFEVGKASSWKPSDEQIRPLEYAIEYFKKKKNDVTYLESLYNDLMKL